MIHISGAVMAQELQYFSMLLTFLQEWPNSAGIHWNETGFHWNGRCRQGWGSRHICVSSLRCVFFFFPFLYYTNLYLQLDGVMANYRHNAQQPPLWRRRRTATSRTSPLHNAQPPHMAPPPPLKRGFLLQWKGAWDVSRLEPPYVFFYSTNAYLGWVSLQMDMAGLK